MSGTVIQVTRAKVTRIWQDIGMESKPEDAVVENGCIILPEPMENNGWGIFLPLAENGVMFYRLMNIYEGDFEEGRRLRIGAYQAIDLLGCEAAPYTEEESRLEGELLRRNVQICEHNLLCERGRRECKCDPAIFIGLDKFPEYLIDDVDFFDEFTEIAD